MLLLNLYSLPVGQTFGGSSIGEMNSNISPSSDYSFMSSTGSSGGFPFNPKWFSSNPWMQGANIAMGLGQMALSGAPRNVSTDPKFNAEYWNQVIPMFQPMWENADIYARQAQDRYNQGMQGMLGAAGRLSNINTGDIRGAAGRVGSVAGQIRGGDYLKSMDTGIGELSAYKNALATGSTEADRMYALQQAEAEKRGMMAPGMTAAQREAANRQSREMGALSSYGERQGAYGQATTNLAGMRGQRSGLELQGLSTAGQLYAQQGNLLATATGLDIQSATALAQIYQAYGTTGDPYLNFLMQEINWRTGVLGQATGSKQRTTTGG